MDSLYDKYKLELENCYTTYIPSVGFASWSVEEELNGIYIQDLYVSPEKRGNKLYKDIINKCVEEAIEKDIPVHIVYTSLSKDLKKFNKYVTLLQEFDFIITEDEDNSSLYFCKDY